MSRQPVDGATILRARKRDRWTVIDNITIEDERLSFRALGLLVYILSKPDNWKTHVGHLASTHKEGREAVRAAIMELEDTGYIARKWMRAPGEDTPSMHYVVSEMADFEDVAARPGSRQADNPLSDPLSADSWVPGSGGPQESAPSKEGSKEGVSTDLSNPLASPVGVSLALVPPLPSQATEDSLRLCTLLADLIEANGSKRPAITARWAQECDRLVRIDGRTPEQVERAIRWCQADSFWCGNILSMPTLRKQFDRLRLAAKHAAAVREGRAQPAKANRADQRVSELLAWAAGVDGA